MAANYWIVLDNAPTTTTTADEGYAIAVDSVGNCYVTGDKDDGSITVMFVAKYNKYGVCQWYRRLSVSSYPSYGRSIAVDASGNCYITGMSRNANNLDIVVLKLNTYGALLWQRVFYDPGNTGGTDHDAGYGIYVDTTGNCYITGYAYSGTSNDIVLIKLDSTGAQLWQTKLYESASDIGYGVAVDTSGNSYIVGSVSNGSNNDILIAKYNSSGTIQWQNKFYGGAGGNDDGYGIAVDGSGNCYVVGNSQPGYYEIVVAKYNTSGTLQWQRRLYRSGACYGRGVDVDSDGNVYVVGYAMDSVNVIIVAKYNTSGTIQWHRKLYATGASLGYGIAVGSSGDVHIVGSVYNGSNYDLLVAKLPGSGAGSGTYGPLIYASSSLTDAEASLTSGSSAMTSSGGATYNDPSYLTSTTVYDLYQPEDTYLENVVLLMHMNGLDGGTAFTDEKGHAVTAYGSAHTEVDQKKFGDTSGYFNAVGDYLYLDDSEDWNFGTGDVTIEFWIYPTNVASLAIMGQWDSGGTSAYKSFNLYTDSNGKLTFEARINSQSVSLFPSTSTYLAANAWQHVAICRSGDTLLMFQNGTQTATTTGASGTWNNSAYKLAIGRQGELSSAQYMKGYIDEVRITKGVARYTVNFTSPSSPFPNPPDPYFSSVALLMHMEGTDGGTTFTDQKGHTVTATGNVHTEVDQKKFGSTSAYFDGTGDYLRTATSSDFNFGTGDFTVEAFAYLTNDSSGRAVVDTRDANWQYGMSLRYHSTTRYIRFTCTEVASSYIDTTTQVPLNTWVHLAVTRASGTTRIFIDGVLSASGSNSLNLSNTFATIGDNGGNSEPFQGYIDDVRITKGVARYTATFAPPSSPFSDE